MSAQQQPLNFSDDLLISSHVAHNAGVLFFSRAWASLVAGSVLGIVGWSGWSGFVWYFAAHAVATGMLYMKTGGNVDKYFKSAWSLYTEEVFGSSSLLTFILFWTLGYNIVYLF